jgi:S-formylglutathione hydrolase FrmB
LEVVGARIPLIEPYRTGETADCKHDLFPARPPESIMIGLKHHEMFASVNSHSGAVGILQEDWSTSKDVKDIRPELERIYGKSPKGGPEDPFGIVERIDHDRVPALRIDCGKGDFLIEQNRAFHRHLESQHIPHEYEEHVGVHNWEYWDLHVQEAVAFHARNLKLTR